MGYVDEVLEVVKEEKRRSWPEFLQAVTEDS